MSIASTETSTWPSTSQRLTLVPRPNTPSDSAYSQAADALGIEIKLIKAFAKVEGGEWGAFLPDGRPIILFERHWFHRLTSGKYDNYGIPGVLSNSKPGGYGKISAQYSKLEQASKLDKEAAHKSCSWGLFQIMGFNHLRAGYPDVFSFVDAINLSVDNHLRSFVSFIKSDPKLYQALKDKNWLLLGLLYNGDGNTYGSKIKFEYERG